MMSYQAIAWVLEHSRSRGFERLVLISLAHHADKDGANCYPSLARIAAEAGVGRSTVWRAIESLERAGDLVVRRRIGRGNASFYVLRMRHSDAECQALLDRDEKVSGRNQSD